MQIKKQENQQKRQYSRITLKIKVTLIRMVFRKGISLDSAIEQLGLKKTTALNIIKRYKETGSLPMRKFKRVRKNKQEKLSIKKEEADQKQETPILHNSAQNATINHGRPNNPFAYHPFSYGWMGYPMNYYYPF